MYSISSEFGRMSIADEKVNRFLTKFIGSEVDMILRRIRQAISGSGDGPPPGWPSVAAATAVYQPCSCVHIYIPTKGQKTLVEPMGNYGGYSYKYK